MASNIRNAFVTGSGALLDSLTSVTVANTRIKGVTYSGIGTFTITGSQTDAQGNLNGNNIKFVGTSVADAGDIHIPDFGVKMYGPVKVSAPTSAATVAVYYG
jgi:hypothetical protein